MSDHTINRIVWAVDALAEDRALQLKMAKALKTLTQGSSDVVEPVYLLSPDQLRLAPSLFEEESQNLRATAEGRLTALLKKAQWPQLLPPTLLVSVDYSLRMAVQTLLTHAHRTGADAIAVSTFARKGVTRFLLGSFAETLILQSDLPVFVVSPHTQLPKRFKDVIYPTDLSQKSNDIYNDVTTLAQKLAAKITVFHNVEYYTPYMAEVYASVPAYEAFLEGDIDRRKSAAEELKKRAEKMGVKTEIKITEKAKSTSGAITTLGKKMPASIIAMASQTGPVASAIMGSVTREVLRQSTVPLWIVHPKK
jgi:nucleotide-binding universal stress UspA family protein